MSSDKLFIPTKCKVGFQERRGTYTGKLGYVIYNDGKVWRKEKSWLGWCVQVIDEEQARSLSFSKHTSNIEYRNERIKEYKERLDKNPDDEHVKWCLLNQEEYLKNEEESFIADPFYALPSNLKCWEDFKPQEFENVPTSGFVLNKTAGGGHYSWNNRDIHVRIYDPRGFEFEISVENLLFILQECDCSKGKGLDGEFVYAWAGTELVLLPCISDNFKESSKFTATVSSIPVKTEDLVVGAQYMDKNGQNHVYLGRYFVTGDFTLKHCYTTQESINKKNTWFNNQITLPTFFETELDIVDISEHVTYLYEKGELYDPLTVPVTKLSSLDKLHLFEGCNYGHTYNTCIEQLSDTEYNVYEIYISSGYSNHNRKCKVERITLKETLTFSKEKVKRKKPKTEILLTQEELQTKKLVKLF